MIDWKLSNLISNHFWWIESFFKLTREWGSTGDILRFKDENSSSEQTWASTGDILRYKDENSSSEQTQIGVNETNNFLTPLIEYSGKYEEQITINKKILNCSKL